jgi:hypothetical protein
MASGVLGQEHGGYDLIASLRRLQRSSQIILLTVSTRQGKEGF